MEYIKLRSHSGESLELSLPCTVLQGIQTLFPALDLSALACCRVNGRLKSLAAALECPSLLDPVPLDSPEGLQVMRRTLCFLLAASAFTCFPGRRLKLAHALGEGFYFHFLDGPASAADLDRLSRQTRALIDSGARIRPRPMAWDDALSCFKSLGRDDTVLLLENHHEAEVWINQIGDFMDLDHGTLAWDTSRLPEWQLGLRDKGFVFGPGQRSARNESRAIHRVYQEYEHWGNIMGVSTVGQLNQLAGTRGIKDFIWTAEALHQQKIAELARDIANRKPAPRLVLIAGPSSSGKTTFAKKLTIQLKVMGFDPLTLSLDDYFLPRVQTPRDADGQYDFEALQALDIPLLNEQLLQFFQNETVDVPVFDFKIGDRSFGHKLRRLGSGGILVMEGIHGLNDQLTPLVAPELKFKVFASALTQLNIDNLNRIPTTDNRLLRRMIRDMRYRGYSAKDTLNRWPSVRRGENRNIFPFQDSANAVFNSALDYELGVLKTYAEPLLETVRPTEPEYAEARRLLQFMEAFLAIPSELVPDNSILREFIGGSAFKY